MTDTDTKARYMTHLRKIAVKTTLITATAVAGMLLTALLLNLFMIAC